MNLSDQKLLELLHKEKYDASETTSFNPIQMANLYTKSALLVTIVGFLKEQLWLNEKEDEESGKKTSYEEFITPLFQKE
ncbi:MAG: hypothetical protein KC493_13965, partial [Bacteriovoracaceae bacterium]|nr:hypothetical protein [Bacteriovoracaceae bacterium]